MDPAAGAVLSHFDQDPLNHTYGYVIAPKIGEIAISQLVDIFHDRAGDAMDMMFFPQCIVYSHLQVTHKTFSGGRLCIIPVIRNASPCCQFHTSLAALSNNTCASGWQYSVNDKKKFNGEK